MPPRSDARRVPRRARLAALPALEPDTGRCELYAHRPIACRTFGPPMRIEGDDLPPCRLCFVGASETEVDAARGRLDCHASRSRWSAPSSSRGPAGETLIAFALAR